SPIDRPRAPQLGDAGHVGSRMLTGRSTRRSAPATEFCDIRPLASAAMRRGRRVVGDRPAASDRRRSIRRGVLTVALVVTLTTFTSACGLFGDDGPERFDYGDAPSQFSELWRPDGAGPFPAVVMIHGGSWSESTGRDLMDDVADDLAERGIAVWNIEYRRLGEDGGGFPGTFEDVAAAVDDFAGRADE